MRFVYCRMTEGKKWPKVEKTEGKNCSFQKFSHSTFGHFLPSVFSYLQSFSTFSPFLPSVILPSVVFYLWPLSTFSHSTFGHFLPSVILPSVILPSVILHSVILRSVFLLSVILRSVILCSVTVRETTCSWLRFRVFRTARSLYCHPTPTHWLPLHPPPIVGAPNGLRGTCPTCARLCSSFSGSDRNFWLWTLHIGHIEVTYVMPGRNVQVHYVHSDILTQSERPL
jgi:hypothetical protein